MIASRLYIQEMDKMDERCCFSSTMKTRFFGGEGVPPSHVRMSGEPEGMMRK